jgi:CheY-like chemotaxis protein
MRADAKEAIRVAHQMQEHLAPLLERMVRHDLDFLTRSCHSMLTAMVDAAMQITGADMANIQLFDPPQRDNEVHITAADEGSGFNQAQLRGAGGKRGGFGLFGLSERLAMLEGSMTIDSSPGGGSRVVLIAPLAAAKRESAPPSPNRPAQVSVGMFSDVASETTALPGKVRVALVDDHMVMRQGLAGLLRSEPDLEIVGEASDGESAVNLVREMEPDVALMDVSMPGMNVMQATRIIRSELPEVRIIGLSMFEEGEQAAAMRGAGALDYVTKSGPSEAVIAAIRACIRRQPLRTRQAVND